MKITKGLFQDCSESDQPEGTYRYAKNMVDANTLGALENELGFDDLGDLGIQGRIVGIIPMRDSAAILSADSAGIASYIGYVTRQADKSLVYTNVISDTHIGEVGLDFDIDKPIKGEYQINAKGERIIAWIQEGQVPRILNLDNPQIESLSDYELFASNTNPFWTVTQSNGGGSLLSAAYVPIIRFTDSSGKFGSWIMTGTVVNIINDPLSGAITTDGCEAGTPTSKSITIDLTDTDTSFDTIEFGLLEMKGGTLTAYKVQEMDSASSVSFTYTGNETRTDISLDEVFTSPNYILGAKAITQLSNKLILGNLEYEEQLDLQAVANKIKINYFQATVSNVAYNVDETKSFQSGEVYAFYLIVELNSGNHAAYHIPGRGPTASERANSTFVDSLTGVQKFQVENTADTASAVTNMGFWENQDEIYPDDFPVGYSWSGADETLAGQKVRHHRFPELETVLSTVPTAHTRLGVHVSNVIIPEASQSKIKGWRIGYAKRSYNNSTVLGGDLLQFAHKYTSGDVGSVLNLWSSSGGNFTDTYKGAGTLSDRIHRGHSLDLLYDKPNVTPTYAKFIYSLSRQELDDTYSSFGNQGARDKITINALYQLNYASTYAARTLITSGSDRAVALSNFQYVPQDTSVTVGSNTITTINTEEIIHADLSTFSAATTHYYSGDVVPSENVGGSFRMTGFGFRDEAQSVYLQYRQVPSNVYSSYKQQQIIFIGDRAAASDTTLNDLYGDVFITLMTYSTNTPYNFSDANPGIATIYFNCFLGEARHNWKLRYEDGTDEGKYFPVSDLGTFRNSDNTLTLDLTSIKNILNYNTDYDFQPEAAVEIVDDIDEYTTTGPNTVIWSIPGSSDSVDTGWRTFPANQRYTMPKHRGEIVNLQGINNRELIIHHEDSFFITKANLSLSSNEDDDINLQAVELFSIDPEELVTSEGGYGGTQHALSCKVTKAGYFFVDAKQGKCFLYSGKLQEISSNGMRTFFRDNLANATTGDNAFDASGYVVGYDEYYNRLLLTKKDGDNSFTISYNPTKGTWVSFHDYYLKSLLVLNDGSLYTFDTAKAYRLNAGDRGVYMGATVYPSFVDIVMNPEPELDKVFTELDWQTRLYDTNNKQIWNETFTHVSAWSQDKCTGRIPISRISHFSLFGSNNVRNHGQTWYFNDLYDIANDTDFLLGFYDDYEIDTSKLNSNATWYQKRKFIDKYIIYRLEYSNALNRRLLLLDSGAAMSLSPI